MSATTVLSRLVRVREVLDYARALHTLATHGRLGKPVRFHEAFEIVYGRKLGGTK